MRQKVQQELSARAQQGHEAFHSGLLPAALRSTTFGKTTQCAYSHSFPLYYIQGCSLLARFNATGYLAASSA